MLDLSDPTNPERHPRMSTSPAADRGRELDAWRAHVIGNLRQLADLLASTSRVDLPTPDVHVSVYSIETPSDDDPYATRSVTVDDVRAAMAAAPGGWRKVNLTDDINYIKAIGDGIRFRFNVDRATTCRRVQVGTKHVEATDAHDEPVYQWVCDDSAEAI